VDQNLANEESAPGIGRAPSQRSVRSTNYRLLPRPLFSSPEMSSLELPDDPLMPSLLPERLDEAPSPDDPLWLELLPERFDDDAFWLELELPDEAL
jgi:hypothetical protein